MSQQTITVADKREHAGQTNADVHVVNGGYLLQSGQLNGNALVDSGGTLEQHGQLNGDLHAYGTAVVRGQVNGTIHVHAGSNVLIAEGTMLLGSGPHRFVAPDGTFQPVPKGKAFVTSGGGRLWRLEPDGNLTTPAAN